MYSGDTGFYSGASALVERLQAQGYQPVVLPGLSSVQLLAAALGRSWQEWKLVSAHGCACDPVADCLPAGERKRSCSARRRKLRKSRLQA